MSPSPWPSIPPASMSPGRNRPRGRPGEVSRNGTKTRGKWWFHDGFMVVSWWFHGGLMFFFGIFMGFLWDFMGILSGQRLHNYGKSPGSMGKSTVNGHVQ